MPERQESVALRGLVVDVGHSVAAAVEVGMVGVHHRTYAETLADPRCSSDAT